MSRGIIYLIANKKNGYKYVGQTTQGMNKSWKQHIQESLRMSDKPIHRAMRKYGNHNFIIKEIDECDGSLLNEKEGYWIKHYNTFNEGYNATSSEDEVILPVRTIKKITEEALTTRMKKDSWGLLTNENRGDGKHCGLRIVGKNLTTGEVKEYESARTAAFELTGDPNKNSNILRAANSNGISYNHKWQLLENKSKKKPVFGVNKRTEQIEVRYESIAEAVRQLGESSKGSGLIKSLRNPGHYSWKGYWWFYSN